MIRDDKGTSPEQRMPLGTGCSNVIHQVSVLKERISLEHLMSPMKLLMRQGVCLEEGNIKSDNGDGEQTLFRLKHPGGFIPVASIE